MYPVQALTKERRRAGSQSVLPHNVNASLVVPSFARVSMNIITSRSVLVII